MANPSNPLVLGKTTKAVDGSAVNTPGATVESTVVTPKPNYDDATVNYTAFAKAICDCSYESNRLNNEMQNLASQKKSKEFSAMAPKVNAAFQESVNCSKVAAEKLNSEWSPFKLVPQLKKECGELHEDLVAQVLRGLGLPI